jgi:hypothetical protein
VSANSDQFNESLRKVLNDKDLRILAWRLIVEDCKVFQVDYPMNASAYSLLAKQELGKRLLEDLKRVDINLVHQAEKDYHELMMSNDSEEENGDY